MKTPLMLSLSAVLLLAACAGGHHRPHSDAPAASSAPAAGVANPASVFCIEQGGKSETRKDVKMNEYGVCILPDGRVLDEWDYFREYKR
ncbi:putative hemolysin [Neisseria animalis]|uniref:DUF333 domain-containing protein n=1 Tax=Neisseria animalis TaxID=492 RepID=A0A5P3MRH4_NEIAN|nr:DUF333 domain-containing protein [Neisseria animalis]QEY24138.1 DUF333 domain-containing protein [Neisseria animalis]ROW31504.1 DUF333 domain-containing protein [Neisseria animalis]VEE06361.1 Putative hemolysin [Neisseria animalis]